MTEHGIIQVVALLVEGGVGALALWILYQLGKGDKSHDHND
jgi:hypothetical protein